MIRLGVNVDHVATVRQARRGQEPDPVLGAHQAELGGADQITIHLREDRRHIQDRDLNLLRQTVTVPLNLELALAEEVMSIAAEIQPDQLTFVPEKREEVTTEGGLDVVSNLEAVRAAAGRFRELGLGVSLFIDPDPEQLEATHQAGVTQIELHTGAYANAKRPADVQRELERLQRAAAQAERLELHLAMGHGLNYTNIQAMRGILNLEEVNIGHSIVSRALFVGLRQAVREMKDLLLAS